jgi:uncharacterized membrane protein
MAEEMKKTSGSSSAPQGSKGDVEKNKGMAIVAYLIFFVPLLTESKNSPFAKYHVKQGLINLIVYVVLSFVGAIIPFLGWFIILPLSGLIYVIFLIIGIINASNGQMKPLPLIGKWGEQWFKF